MGWVEKEQESPLNSLFIKLFENRVIERVFCLFGFKQKDNLFIFLSLFSLGKLNVSSDTIQHGVEGLTYLLTESSKLMVRLLRMVLYYPDPFRQAPVIN